MIDSNTEKARDKRRKRKKGKEKEKKKKCLAFDMVID